jgi:hypothetical protein
VKARTGILTCLFLVLGCYVASAGIASAIAGSPAVKITPPSEDLAPELAAFSGIWECHSHGVLPSRLIVEEIHPNWATVVYSWADHPTGEPKAGWARVRTKVFPDGKMQWGFPGKFTVEVAGDGMTIEGKKEQGGRVATFTMKKVGPFVGR